MCRQLATGKNDECDNTRYPRKHFSIHTIKSGVPVAAGVLYFPTHFPHVRPGNAVIEVFAVRTCTTANRETIIIFESNRGARSFCVLYSTEVLPLTWSVFRAGMPTFVEHHRWIIKVNTKRQIVSRSLNNDVTGAPAYSMVAVITDFGWEYNIII